MRTWLTEEVRHDPYSALQTVQSHESVQRNGMKVGLGRPSDFPGNLSFEKCQLNTLAVAGVSLT
jgi:hypothetical protein